MPFVVYVGPYKSVEALVPDLTVFQKGKSVEVSDEAATNLLSQDFEPGEAPTPPKDK